MCCVQLEWAGRGDTLSALSCRFMRSFLDSAWWHGSLESRFRYIETVRSAL